MKIWKFFRHKSLVLLCTFKKNNQIRRFQGEKWLLCRLVWFALGNALVF